LALFSHMLVVPLSSSNVFGDLNVHSFVQEDHLSIVKPRSKEAVTYLELLAFIHEAQTRIISVHMTLAEKDRWAWMMKDKKLDQSLDTSIAIMPTLTLGSVLMGQAVIGSMQSLIIKSLPSIYTYQNIGELLGQMSETFFKDPLVDEQAAEELAMHDYYNATNIELIDSTTLSSKEDYLVVQNTLKLNDEKTEL